MIVGARKLEHSHYPLLRLESASREPQLALSMAIRFSVSIFAYIVTLGFLLAVTNAQASLTDPLGLMSFASCNKNTDPFSIG